MHGIPRPLLTFACSSWSIFRRPFLSVAPPPLDMAPKKRLRQATFSFAPQASGADNGAGSGSVELSRPAKHVRENWPKQQSRAQSLRVMLPPAWIAEAAAAAAMKEPRRVCAFDMDGTLITTKSGAKFPKSPDDWKFLSPRVVKKLREEHASGAVLVIFSNQAGLVRGTIDDAFIHERVEGIVGAIGVPVAFYAAGGKDRFRKPAMGMWEAFLDDLGGRECVKGEGSLFCGDAAGRPKRPGGVRADFADGDRKFALNVGLRFCTPEIYFNGAAAGDVDTLPIKGYDPRVVEVTVAAGGSSSVSRSADAAEVLRRTVTPSSVVDRLLLHSGDGGEAGDSPSSAPKADALTMVILCGSPASGKTSFAEKHLLPRGFTIVGSDIKPLTPAKYGKMVTECLAAGRSVCVDMTMRNKKARSLYIDKARKSSTPVHIIVLVFNTPPDVVQHLNVFRELVTSVGDDGKPVRPRVPAVAINTFRAHYTAPDVDEEDIDDVGYVEFVPQVESEHVRDLYQKLYQ